MRGADSDGLFRFRLGFVIGVFKVDGELSELSVPYFLNSTPLLATAASSESSSISSSGALVLGFFDVAWRGHIEFVLGLVPFADDNGRLGPWLAGCLLGGLESDPKCLLYSHRGSFEWRRERQEKSDISAIRWIENV